MQFGMNWNIHVISNRTQMHMYDWPQTKLHPTSNRITKQGWLFQKKNSQIQDWKLHMVKVLLCFLYCELNYRDQGQSWKYQNKLVTETSQSNETLLTGRIW